jgi:DNA-binding transcriptional MerR regulator
MSTDFTENIERFDAALKRKDVFEPLQGIKSYNSELINSQVVRFFQRGGVAFSKAMIQNYVHAGALPPPKDGRIYLRYHLACLAVIDDLKKAFNLEEITQAIRDFPEEESLFRFYGELCLEAAQAWQTAMDELMNKIAAQIEAWVPEGVDPQAAFDQLALLTLMAQGSAIKQTVDRIEGS